MIEIFHMRARCHYSDLQLGKCLPSDKTCWTQGKRSDSNGAERKIVIDIRKGTESNAERRLEMESWVGTRERKKGWEI